MVTKSLSLTKFLYSFPKLFVYWILARHVL